MTLSPPEAMEAILAEISPLQPERVALMDALGRVLAAPVTSPVTLPLWDNSAMDGYAVRAADVRGSSRERPSQLRVIETIVAGAFAKREVGAGEASRIMTGAPVPNGADSVVRIEDSDDGTETVHIFDDRDAERNIRPRGEDISAGDVVLERGQIVGAAQIGVLASVGAAQVDVHRRPRVAIIGSGDELVELDHFSEVLAGRRIVSSNSYTLRALVTASGCEPVDLGIARDTLDDMKSALGRAAGCDLIVTSAGVSVGEHDHTRAAMQDLGGALKFWKVRMRPGAQMGFGMLGTTPWIGLPGNPVSTMVTFELFVRAALRKMMGHSCLHRIPVAVRMEEKVTTAGRTTFFLRAIVSAHTDGTHAARLTGPQGSGILTSMSRANALLIVPEDRTVVEAGEMLNAILLHEDAALSQQFAL